MGNLQALRRTEFAPTRLVTLYGVGRLGSRRREEGLCPERSSSVRALNDIDEFLNAAGSPFRGQTHTLDGLDHKALRLWWVGGMRKASKKDTVYGLLHRLTSTTVFFFEKGRHVIVDGKSCSHIMMLSKITS